MKTSEELLVYLKEHNELIKNLTFTIWRNFGLITPNSRVLFETISKMKLVTSGQPTTNVLLLKSHLRYLLITLRLLFQLSKLEILQQCPSICQTRKQIGSNVRNTLCLENISLRTAEEINTSSKNYQDILKHST